MEFLVDNSGHFYFMEMNTRIQVEHTITEEVYGCDLVKEQIRIAAGERLSPHIARLCRVLHAIQCPSTPRIRRKKFPFLPGGKLHFTTRPGGRGIRVDSHAYTGYVVPPYYDSLIAKLIAVGASRTSAIDRMRRALDEYYITGIKTTVDSTAPSCAAWNFQGKYDTGFVERLMNSTNSN